MKYTRDVVPWHDVDYMLSVLPNMTREEFVEVATYNRESEHQAGRYLNWRDIADAVLDKNLDGDVVEFGTHQGTGLLMLAQCFAGSKTKRCFFGIDSFEGLPESSTIWVKGKFNDTSEDFTLEKIESRFPKNDMLQYSLIKGWFNQPHVSEKLYAECKNPVVVHFDADLGSSTLTALNIVERYLADRKDPIYFCFDDWGCHPDEVPVAWQTWLAQAQQKFNLQAQEISSTYLTKNFILTFNCP